MKIKNLLVGKLIFNKKEKIVLMRETSKFEKFICISTNANLNQYHDFFTENTYFFGGNEVVPFCFFLSTSEAKKNMRKSEIKRIFMKKEKEIQKTFSLKQNPIGFIKK